MSDQKKKKIISLHPVAKKSIVGDTLIAFALLVHNLLRIKYHDQLITQIALMYGHEYATKVSFIAYV